MPALVQPFTTQSRVSWFEYTWCRFHTGHFSGSPGSVRRTRAGSVGIVRTFFVTSSAGSRSRIALP